MKFRFSSDGSCFSPASKRVVLLNRPRLKVLWMKPKFFSLFVDHFESFYFISPGGWKPVGTIPSVFMMNWPVWSWRFSRKNIETWSENCFELSHKSKSLLKFLLECEHLGKRIKLYREVKAIRHHSTVHIAGERVNRMRNKELTKNRNKLD